MIRNITDAGQPTTLWTIQQATLQEASAIARFQVAMAMESEGTELDYYLVLRGVSEGIKDPNKGTYLVAIAPTGDIAGSLLITKEWSDWRCAWYWWIQSVYVCPEHRQQGVFRTMYGHVIQMAKEAQSPCVRLYVDNTNQRGLATYQAVGMQQSHYLLYETEL